jgi:hypothetical protein
MTVSNRVTDEDVLSVYRELSDPSEALSASEVANALDCSRRTAYARLAELADGGPLHTKKVGKQVRIWWLATDHDDPATTTVEGRCLSDLAANHVVELAFQSEQMARPNVRRDESDLRVSVEGAVSLPDGTHLQYWTVTGPDIDTHVEVVQSREACIDVRLLSTVGGEHRTEIHSTADSLFATLAEFDGRPTGGYLEDGKLRLTSSRA